MTFYIFHLDKTQFGGGGLMTDIYWWKKWDSQIISVVHFDTIHENDDEL